LVDAIHALFNLARMTRYVRGQWKESYVWTISIKSTAGTFLATTPTETGVVVTAFLICYGKGVARGIRGETGSINELCEDTWNNSNDKKKEAKKLFIREKWRGGQTLFMIQCVEDMQKFTRDGLFLYGCVSTPSQRSTTAIALPGEWCERRRVRTLLQK